MSGPSKGSAISPGHRACPAPCADPRTHSWACHPQSSGLWAISMTLVRIMCPVFWKKVGTVSEGPGWGLWDDSLGKGPSPEQGCTGWAERRTITLQQVMEAEAARKQQES